MSPDKIFEAKRVDVHCLSLHQICISAQVEETRVLELVDSEVLNPLNDNAEHWLFHPDDLPLLSRADRLMCEFDLSPVGLALVMDLLDELHRLRHQEELGLI